MIEQQRGITVVEILFFLAIVAVIVSASMRHYQQYNEDIILAGVQSDLMQIKTALNQYYYQQGCDDHGVFAGNARPDLRQDLQLKLRDRKPLVVASSDASGYQVAIVATGQHTATHVEKSINQFVVHAHLNAKLNPTQVEWYRQKLDAAVAVDHTLEWRLLPYASGATFNDKFWVLNSAVNEFKQQYQTARVGAVGGNCAR